jgi:uncharacterized protein
MRAIERCGGTLVLTLMLALPAAAQPPVGPWPDPVAVEPPDSVETVPFDDLERGSRVRVEALPAPKGTAQVEAATGEMGKGAPAETDAAETESPDDAAAGVQAPRSGSDLEGFELDPHAPAQLSVPTEAESSAAESGEEPPQSLTALYDQPGRADAGPPPIEPAADPASPEFVGARVIAPFRMLGAKVAPGTRERVFWNASQTYAGGDLRSPVDIVHGDRIGPVLCLTAAIHGDELNGVEVVRRILKQLEPRRLAGTVVGVPVVNLFGFSRNSRYLPDRRDLNRFFPGSPTGSIASRIAYSFFDQVARHCSVLVDMHTGSFDRINLPQVRADLRIPHVLEFTRGFGATPVLHSNGSRGMLRVAATQAGIPAVTFEVGGPGELEPPEIEAGVQALLTLLHKLGMVPDSPEWLEPQAIFYESRWVRANRGGMLISAVALGERVQRGQRIGVIVDPLENAESDIVASVSGRVIGMALNQVVLPGYAIFHLGEETSETGAVSRAASGQAVLPYEEDAARPHANGELDPFPVDSAIESEPLDGVRDSLEDEFE